MLQLLQSIVPLSTHAKQCPVTGVAARGPPSANLDCNFLIPELGHCLLALLVCMPHELLQGQFLQGQFLQGRFLRARDYRHDDGGDAGSGFCGCSGSRPGSRFYNHADHSCLSVFTSHQRRTSLQSSLLPLLLLLPLRRRRRRILLLLTKHHRYWGSRKAVRTCSTASCARRRTDHGALQPYPPRRQRPHHSAEN